jgi:hypothetical protein
LAAGDTFLTSPRLPTPKRFAFDAEDKNSIFHHEFLFTGEGDGTRVERRVTMVEAPGATRS